MGLMGMKDQGTELVHAAEDTYRATLEKGSCEYQLETFLTFLCREFTFQSHCTVYASEVAS